MLQLDLERRNFQLRYEQLAGEKGDLKAEVSRLREKVELLSLEKNLLEQQGEERVSSKARQESWPARAAQCTEPRPHENIHLGVKLCLSTMKCRLPTISFWIVLG